jgi:DNA-binding winged helix-turn-helix (wHTH) protein
LSKQTFRFAAFELDARSGELRKRGIRIKLQDQPLRILVLLLERAGETVSRAEIRDKLWPENTFVDFENAISAGVRKVREALNDNPDSPRFVETVARHGYRFICPLSKVGEIAPTVSSIENGGAAPLEPADANPESDLNGRESVTQPPRIRGQRGMVWAFCCVALPIVMIASWWLGRRFHIQAEGNPLANATFSRFADFPGEKTDASISPDGKFVAFRADRDGRSDVWLSQVGTGRFVNLTKEQPEDPILPISNLGFSPDGSQIWLAGYRPNQRLRFIPLMGGVPRPFLRDHTANVAWSPDGSRLVFHTYEPGDPMFVADADGANARQIFALGPGGHNHFQAWSIDSRWIYFVSGPWESLDMDLWRIPASGGVAERMTQHNSDVRSVVPISSEMLLYTAPQQDGSGPWLWALNVKTKTSRRVSIGLEHYLSVSASADRKHLIATASNPSANLWSVPILARPSTEADIKPYKVPNSRALAPRFGRDFLFYLSAQGSGDGLWRYREGQAFEVWKGANGPLFSPAAISPDASSAVVVVSKQGRLVLYRISADGARDTAVGA